MSSIALDPEDLLRRVHDAYERVALFDRVVQVEARAGRRRDAEPRHKRLVAVVPGPDAHGLAVEDRRDVVRMDPLDVEGHHPDPVLERLGPVDRDARYLLQARQQVADERELV